MASKPIRPVQISPRLGISLSVFMILIAALTFTNLPIGNGAEWPVLTTFRDPRSDLNILNHRARQAPPWLYQGAKGLVSMLWSILIPLQHNKIIRGRYPWFHRRSGYTIVLLSAELGIAGYYMLSQDMVTTHDKWYHIHTFYDIPFPPFAWPTFTGALIVLGIFYFYSLYKMVIAIRVGNVEQHRRWAVFHNMTGYAIPIERLIAIGLIGFGWFLNFLPEKIKWQWLKMPTDLPGMLEVERDALAWTLTASGLTVAFWTYSEFSSAGLIGTKSIQVEMKTKKAS